MKLVDYMKINGIRPEDVAEEFNIPLSSVYAYMKQDTIPRPQRMKQIIAWSNNSISVEGFYKR